MIGRRASEPAAGEITAVFLPNVRQAEKLAGLIPGSGPDLFRIDREFARHGVTKLGVDLNEYPLNPLARCGPFYAGFDPWRAIMVLCRQRHVELVVCTFDSGLLLVALLARMVRFRPKLVVWDVPPRGWRIRDRVLDILLPRVDRVLVLTEAQKAHVDTTYQLRAPSEIVGFAVDDLFYGPLRRDRQDFLLAVGDDAGRDYDILLAACRPTAYRLVLRTGRTLAIPADMRDRVTVLGLQSYEELRELYATAALVVVPLRHADNPSGITAAFEALAMGCALVITAGTASSGVIDDDIAVRVPPGDRAALTASIEDLMRSPERRRSLGVAARQAIDGRLSYERHIARFAACLRRAAGPTSSAASPAAAAMGE